MTPSIHNRYFYLFTLFAAISLLSLWELTGCKGPSGPDGADAALTDSLPPSIIWLNPPPNSIIDTLVVLEAAAADNQGIWRMSFYIAGFEFSGTLADSARGLYRYVWNARYYPQGPYPLQARAWDAARNAASTPVCMVSVAH